MGADAHVETSCFDEETGESIAGCPFWIGEINGCCLLVQNGMDPEDCPMDGKFHWWGYWSRTEQPVFSDEQVKVIREMLTDNEQGESEQPKYLHDPMYHARVQSIMNRLVDTNVSDVALDIVKAVVAGRFRDFGCLSHEVYIVNLRDILEPTSDKPCPTCGGSRYIPCLAGKHGDEVTDRECPTCHGTGKA